MIVTLTTDFGTADHYVAVMKVAVLKQCPSATLIDVTHAVPPQDVLAGSFVLERAVAEFPPGSVHLAVVDPGVGTSRRLMVARANGSLVVCPDNGLITWTVRRHAPVETFELLWDHPARSSTFHGRDIFAPAAGMLAGGVPLATLSRPLTDAVLLDVHLAQVAGDGRIVHVDHYGNATTNILAEQVDPAARVQIGDRDLGPTRRTYQDVPRGSPLALIGSSGLLEIAVRDSSAAARLGVRVGDAVHCR